MRRYVILSLTVALVALAVSSAAQTPPVCDANGPYEGPTLLSIIFDGTGSFDPDGSIVLYEWQFGDGHATTGAQVDHAYEDAGSYTITLCVTDNDSDVSCCGTFAVVTDPDGSPPVCDPNGPYSGSVGEPIQFDGSSSSSPGGTIVAYDWDFGDGATGQGSMPQHTYIAGGVFTVTLTVTDDSDLVSSCLTIADVTPVPVEPATWGHIKALYRSLRELLP